MPVRSTLLRARWLLLLLPAFALFSTLQVGCVGGADDRRDDYVHEDPKDSPNGGYGGPRRPGGYDDDPYYGGGGYYDDEYGY